MSLTKTKELVDRITDLPIGERAKAVEQILETFHRPDPDIEQAWMNEVDRRAAQVASGEAELIPAEDVFKGLQETAKG